VAIISAANQGHLDRVDVADVPKVNEAIRSELHDRGADLLADIRDTKDLSDETAAKVDAIVTEVVARFVPEEEPEAQEREQPAEEAAEEPAPAAA
jgi:F-type H+-transporting ATPase subunit alpha